MVPGSYNVLRNAYTAGFFDGVKTQDELRTRLGNLLGEVMLRPAYGSYKHYLNLDGMIYTFYLFKSRNLEIYSEGVPLDV